MQAPEVCGYGDFNVEPFKEYVERWPSELASFPRDLLETWVYRHWGEFSNYWMPNGALEWNYELRTFSNEDVLRILTFEKMLETMDYWGDELFRNRQRRETWLAKFMLEHGTVPSPILVFEGGANKVHPRGLPGEKMLEPFQLIEGHMRTAYLRGMIRHSHSTLMSAHQVWVATDET